MGADLLIDGLFGLDVENGDAAQIGGDAHVESFGGMESTKCGATKNMRFINTLFRHATK